MIRLYQFEISPYADKVRRALRLKGVPFEIVEVPVSRPGTYRRISPTGKFPALVHAGGVIVDSTDILEWLDQHFPQPRLLPDEPADRALATILEDWADEALYFYDLTMRCWPRNRQWFIDDLLAHERGPSRRLLAALIPGAIGKVARTQGLGRKPPERVLLDLRRQYGALDTRLAGSDWLAGPRLSNADLAVRVMLNVIDRTVEGRELVKDFPALAAWARRVDDAAPPEGLSVTGDRHAAG